MILAKFNIIPLYLSTNDYTYKIIVDKEAKTFPYFFVEQNSNLIETIKFNIEKYIESESGIYKTKLTDIDITNNVDIYYIAFLPYDSNIKPSAQAIEISQIYEYLPKNSQQIISLL